MHRLVFVLIVFCFISNSAFAFKVYRYNEKGERVYRTITQEDIRRNKAAPKRSFVRLPRIGKLLMKCAQGIKKQLQIIPIENKK